MSASMVSNALGYCLFYLILLNFSEYYQIFKFKEKPELNFSAEC